MQIPKSKLVILKKFCILLFYSRLLLFSPVAAFAATDEITVEFLPLCSFKNIQNFKKSIDPKLNNLLKPVYLVFHC